MYLTLILVAIFFACMALLYNAGLWGNAITLVNVVTSCLLAVSLFEPLSKRLQEFEPSYTYVIDFLAMWGVFAVSMGILRGLTDAISLVKVRFKKPVDVAGGMIFAAWIGWVMICFTLMSLHTAPLARNSFGGAFAPTPMSNMFLGVAPDRQMLGFVHKMSKGTLSRSGPKGNEQAYVFDPNGEFIFKYGARREQFESLIGNVTR